MFTFSWRSWQFEMNRVHSRSQRRSPKNATIRDNNVITPCYTAVICQSYFPPGPSRCEHDSSTVLAEPTRSHLGGSVTTPSAFRGCSVAFRLILCYCHVNPRWGRLHNVLRVYSQCVHGRSAILGHGSWRFENCCQNHRCLKVAFYCFCSS